MESDKDLSPDTDDLPLRANTNHILVRHYVLNLTVHIDRKVISGSAVLFLEPSSGEGTEAEDALGIGATEEAGTIQTAGSHDRFDCRLQDAATVEDGAKGFEQTMTGMEVIFGAREKDRAEFQALSGVVSQTAPETENVQSSDSWKTTSDCEFTLILDCCDLDVSKVEEVDVTSVSSMSSFLSEVSPETSEVSSMNSKTFIQNLISMPSSQCWQKHQLFLLTSQVPGAQDGSSLPFYRDQWSLQVRKKGVTSPQEFPRALRICYETKPTGGSVRWTKDQDKRFISGYK